MASAVKIGAPMGLHGSKFAAESGHNKDIFERLDDTFGVLERLHIY